ncbi:MAG: hypothetical protein RL339_2879 [Pseudomonadota bacterium]|jgi:glycosyltransferase involved in cell wall biosynthesis
MKPRILHISADYPDRFQPAKTQAISGLVEGTGDQFEHLVVSLNRAVGATGVIRPGQTIQRDLTGSLLALCYAAPPAAVAIGSAMARLADTVARELAEVDFRPDLIQGHKLTIEGLLARQLSARIGVPFALTLQGNTDQKLMTQRPDRLPLIRQIWLEARTIMAFAPWTAQWCTARLGHAKRSVSIIPCLLGHDAILPPKQGGMLIRTAFHLDFWRNKNLPALLAAISRLAPQFPSLRLEIAGGGSPDAVTAIQHQIAKRGLEDRVSLVGPVAPEAIQAWFNAAALFALPSRRESFGMVFAEALLAGTPVIHPRGAAIDGFFPDRAFARSVAADNPQELGATIGELLSHQAEAKAQLAAAQAAGQLDLFRRDKVLASYAAFLRQALR